MKRLCRKYSHIWIVLAYMPLYLLWYFFLQQMDASSYHDIYTWIDAQIPYVPCFIWAYMYWFFFVSGVCLWLFFKSRGEFYRVCGALFSGMTICLLIFTFYPTSFAHRPILTGDLTLSERMTAFIYGADQSVNVFPSIHVYNSIVCAAAVWKSDVLRHKKVLSLLAAASALLIILSTMLVRQHSILDVLGGAILAGGICFLLYGKKRSSKKR